MFTEQTNGCGAAETVLLLPCCWEVPSSLFYSSSTFPTQSLSNTLILFK